MYWSQVGLADGTDEGTVFIERRLDPYIAYLSRFASYLLESCTILSISQFRWLGLGKTPTLSNSRLSYFLDQEARSSWVACGAQEKWTGGKVSDSKYKFQILWLVSLFLQIEDCLFNIKVKPGRLTVHPWGQLAIKFLHRWTPLSVKLQWFPSQENDDVDPAQVVVVVYCLKSISTWL